MRKFFKDSDDFFYIINSQVKSVKSISQISTGWTNFVFRVKARDGTYIFRFPRNDFFSKQLEKECAFLASFDHTLLSVKIPKMKLCSFIGRPFSVHKALKGKPLSKCKLHFWQKQKLAWSAAKFLMEFSSIHTSMPLPTTSEFLRQLSLVSGTGYELKKHTPLIYAERRGLVLSHGDFNPGNILIRHGKMCGVLDFAFVSYSSPLDDIARLVGRMPTLKDFMFYQLEKIGFDESDKALVMQICGVWDYVEQRYIEYIKREHPDIILPEKES